LPHEAYRLFTENLDFEAGNDNINNHDTAIDELTTVTIDDIIEESFSIAKTDDLSSYNTTSFNTYSEAEQYLNAILKASPELVEELMVV